MSNIKNLSKVRLFSLDVKERKGYLYDKALLVSDLVDGVNVSCPINIDTEFRTRTMPHAIKPYETRKRITTQVKGINDEVGMILAAPTLENARHPLATSGFHPVDYLRLMGHDVTLSRQEYLAGQYPTFEFVMYGHFLLAEAMMIVDGQYKDDFANLFRADKHQTMLFAMQRRLRATHNVKKGSISIPKDSVPMDWLLTINGFSYQVKISWMDSCAIHGLAGYADFCEAAGIKLTHKDIWQDNEITRMDEMYFERPDDFDAYSLGDLQVYDALARNAENFRLIYDALGIEHLAKPPAFTIGSTVRTLFTSILQNATGLDDKNYKKFSDSYLKPVSSSYLNKSPLKTTALLAKVEGGRCRNNRPTDVNIVSSLVDMDISGCYGEGQRNQLYPIGKPEIIGWDVDKDKRNKYWTLRQFLDYYKAGTTPETWLDNKGDLVPGCWHLRASTFTPLTIKQDYLASWFVDGKADIDILAKYVAKAMQSDSEQNDFEFNVDDGQLKIFNDEVKNALISHDYIDWLMFVASQKQRKELLDGLYVTVSIVYPASQRVDSFEALIAAEETWDGQNIQTRIVSHDGECHAWYAYGLDDLVINNLLANRKLYTKKTPLNTLYKLCVNTLYGDMVSKFFDEANVVVGNNITARARALAYYMEKGLYGFQTVTDGCVFELNNVLRSFGNGSIVETVNLHRTPKRNRNLIFGSIVPDGSVVTVEWDVLTHYDKDKEKNVTKKYPRVLFGSTVLKPFVNENGDAVIVPAMDWINKTAMTHLQGLFPLVDVLQCLSTSIKPYEKEDKTAGYNLIPRKGQFEFEAKQYYEMVTTQGSANYLLTNPNKSEDNMKMRSYEAKKEHDGFVDHKVTGRYSGGNNPAKDFMTALAANSRSIPRQVPFVKEAILKVSDYKLHTIKNDKNGLEPGDGFIKPGMLRECSLSQFTFKTLVQYKAWDKAITTRKDKYGQSLECFFINEDGSLNFKLMVETIDELIETGCNDPFKALAKWKKTAIDPHPGFETYQALKERFNR